MSITSPLVAKLEQRDKTFILELLAKNAWSVLLQGDAIGITLIGSKLLRIYTFEIIILIVITGVVFIKSLFVVS